MTLYKSIAILRYLERVFPGPKLWPDDVAAAAVCDQWASAVADSLVNASLRYSRRAPASCRCRRKWRRSISPRRRRWCRSSTASWGSIASSRVSSLTVADLYLYPLYAYFPDVAELKAIADKAPNINRWAREMAARPSAVATEPSFKPQIAA